LTRESVPDNLLIVQQIVRVMLRNTQKSHDTIRRAAEELFATSGLQRVSLADVAATAGVSEGLPSYFFKNKETLSRTAMERGAIDVRRKVLDPLRSSIHRDSGRLVANLIDDYSSTWPLTLVSCSFPVHLGLELVICARNGPTTSPLNSLPLTDREESGVAEQ
jgi:AcrR family transcriptional regulator